MVFLVFDFLSTTLVLTDCFRYIKMFPTNDFKILNKKLSKLINMEMRERTKFSLRILSNKCSRSRNLNSTNWCRCQYSRLAHRSTSRMWVLMFNTKPFRGSGNFVLCILKFSVFMPWLWDIRILYANLSVLSLVWHRTQCVDLLWKICDWYLTWTTSSMPGFCTHQWLVMTMFPYESIAMLVQADSTSFAQTYNYQVKFSLQFNWYKISLNTIMDVPRSRTRPNKMHATAMHCQVTHGSQFWTGSSNSLWRAQMYFNEISITFLGVWLTDRNANRIG